MMPKILSELQILTPLIINSRDPQISGMGKSVMISRQQLAVLFAKKKICAVSHFHIFLFQKTKPAFSMYK